MKAEKDTAYIVDSCVLIDYFKVDISILGQFAKRFGQTFATHDAVIEEVDGLDVPACYKAGISIYDPNTDQLEAAGLRRGQLSYFDHLLFLVARDNVWTVITNDENLRAACRESSIDTIRGLRPLVELVRMGHIMHKEAVDMVKRIIANNAYMNKGLLRDFKKSIR